MKTLLTSAAVALALAGALPANAASVYVNKTNTTTPLSAQTGLTNAVLVGYVNLPAGRWTVTAKVSPVNFGKYDIDRCALYDYGQIVDTAATVTGAASNYPLVAVVVMQAAINNTSPMSVGVWCYHDYGVSGQYIDPSASIIATPVPGTIQVQVQ